MSIRVDWEVESEQSATHRVGEDPLMLRRRRQARLRLLMGILLLLGGLGLAVAGVTWRLRQVENALRSALVNTVEAEVTALRIADRRAFLALQRSASDAWLTFQSALFDEYQALLPLNEAQLSGTVTDVVLDGARARVQVQEIINGVPYLRTWFYWRYADGWFHVPPDFTFWGSEQTLTAERITVQYRDVDAVLAQQLVDALTVWFTETCQALICADVPPITVVITPERGAEVRWATDAPWRLQVPSPYVGRARQDRPFDVALQRHVAQALAERVVSAASGGLVPAYPSDAFFLRNSIMEWLIGRFLAVDRGAYLVSGLNAEYGTQTVGALLAVLSPDSAVSVLTAVTGVPNLADLKLDWRDFVAWRIAVEDEMHTQRNEPGFLALYATADPTVLSFAQARYAAPRLPEQGVVLDAMVELQPDGSYALVSRVQPQGTPAENPLSVRFRLQDGTWKRAN